ncbi:phenylalanine--tRNA ligase subunit beta [Clavibacter sp. km1a]|uniref:phenylalanine--tRNA ligase subunit beta n=1 Tax=Clavibacter sp. km1a TaxID=3459136 RepID=UPI00404156D5
MRIPISWLGEHVELPAGVTPEDVHASLVKVGLEEEDVHAFAISGPVVVGQVLEATPEPQTNGKTINWCSVRVAPEGATAADGGEDVRGIVCGAHNFVVGDKVVVSLPGAVLPGPFPISARKTYGHVSDGMIASSRELGLGEEHDGILVLSSLGLDPEVGTDALALLHLDDRAVEVNVTPDRGYAFSIRGIAREYAHATGAAFTDPADALALLTADAPVTGIEVRVADAAPIRGRVGADVFVTRVVSGLDVSRPTPPWMVSRLTLAGVRSISLVVDVTNYVMLELGQPLHGYDLDRLQGGIVVRRAAEGEALVTLDGRERALHVEDLVIADDSGPVGLAGVMGGAATEIGAGTTRVLIEAAGFDPISIARTARRHKLPSEASKRFERGVDPRIAPAAAARAVQLLEELAGGHAEGLGSLLDTTAPPAAVELPVGYPASLVGVDYTEDEVRHALVDVGCAIEERDGVLLVTPPTWRPDLRHRADLVEEVARIVGYDRIPAVLPVAPPGRGLTVAQRLRRQASIALAAGGLTEVMGSPFASEAQNARFGAADRDDAPAVRLANPLDVAYPFLRRSLLPGLIDIARRNLSRGSTDLALYETGTVFLPSAGVAYGSPQMPPGAARPDATTLRALDAGIPPQPRHVGVLILGDAVPKQPGTPAQRAGLVDALDAVRQLAHAVGVEIRFEQGAHAAMHPGRTAAVEAMTADGPVIVGFAGELLPALAAELDLPERVALAEVDLDRLVALAGGTVEVRPLRSMPVATQDLSLVVPLEVPAGELLAAVVEGAGELLETARLVDDYRGPGVEAGTRSLTFALRFRAPDRTLTAAEASEARDGSVRLAGERFGATLRE